jgi:hypothetical protein
MHEFTEYHNDINRLYQAGCLFYLHVFDVFGNPLLIKESICRNIIPCF